LASKDKEVKETPLMKQYNEIKRSILMLVCCLVSDFYETFGEDAGFKILG
jgi:DNA mismatch repair protein MutS